MRAAFPAPLSTRRPAIQLTGIALLVAAMVCSHPAAGSSTSEGKAEPAATTATANITGQVRITRKLTSQKMRFRLYPGVKPIAPPGNPAETAEIHNIVVYLDQADGASQVDITGPNPAIRQEGETFIPHVLPIVKGTTVDFPNLDPIFHNVFSLSGAKSFDLGRYPQGSSRSVTFGQSGVVPVFCHLHSHMSAIILVLDNPYFAVPDADGRYRIGNIPPGTYTLTGWHERSDSTRQQVTLQPGETVELDILIPIDDEE